MKTIRSILSGNDHVSRSILRLVVNPNLIIEDGLANGISDGIDAIGRETKTGNSNIAAIFIVAHFINDLPPHIPKAGEGVDLLGLSARAQNCLIKEGIDTLGKLREKRSGELLRIRNFGRTCLDEVRRQMRALGSALKGETP